MKPEYDAISHGKLTGGTDTDYFYFICPKCNGNEILRILKLDGPAETPGNKYDEQCKSKAGMTFTLGFTLFCEKCGFRGVTKISNGGWQGGELGAAFTAAISKSTAP